MRRLLHLGLALLVLTAGCVVEGGPTSAATFVEESGTACEDVWVSFWGPGVESFLRPDTVRIGYGLPSNASVLFVAYVDGTAEGVLSDQTDADGGIVSDGSAIPLESERGGQHTVQVVAHRDANGDGAFQADADPVCLSDGEIVQAGPRAVNFWV